VLFGAIAAVLPPAAALAEPSDLSVSTSAEVGGYHDSDNVTVLTPVVGAKVEDATAGWSAQGSYLVDIVSAASVDIVSAASPRWHELRHAGTLGAGYKPGAFGVELGGATSVEPDYFALAGGVTGLWEFSQKSALLSAGYSYEHDIAGRSGTPFSVFGLRLDRHTLSAGLELVLGRATTFTPSFDLIVEHGEQQSAYRWLPLFDRQSAAAVPVGASVDEVDRVRLPGRIAERLPQSRARYAASFRLAHRFQRSTLIVWNRAYLDSWGLRAASTDARWVIDLGRRWSVWPHARLHSQSGATFWQRAYVGSVNNGQVTVPEYRTGDRELGPLSSVSFGPGVRFDMGAQEPRSASLTLQLEGTYTQFRDALYIDHRWSAYGVAGLSLRFP
jgi:Protein of unknown function (DUF3570)